MKLMSFLEGLAIGGGAMYLLDPDRGRTRRAMLRDQWQGQMNSKKQALHVMEKDFSNRGKGIVRQVQNRFRQESQDDQVLQERIRSVMGHHVTHPAAITVSCDEGRCVLSGNILAGEMQNLIDVIRTVPGVSEVENQMHVHQASEVTGSGQAGEANAITARWNPAECLVAVASGGLMTLYGMGRRGPVGAIMGLVGIGLLIKGFNDTETRNMPVGTSQQGSLESTLSDDLNEAVQTIEG